MTHESFTALDGNVYQIFIDDSGETISVVLAGKSVGTISLRHIEGEPPFLPEYHHITHLGLDECAHLGIGRRCLELHRKTFDSPITASAADGMRRADGSHLTGDGPGFIAKMRQEGLVIETEGH